jgi:transposase
MTIETVVQRSAGLDIAKASLVACIRTPAAGGGWQIRKRKFSTMTADLLTLAAWLAEHKVTRVGMESTSDYWRAVFYLLEADFECWLLNARHMRAVPGRKTDLLTELADRCFDRCVRRRLCWLGSVLVINDGDVPRELSRLVVPTHGSLEATGICSSRIA